jgi:phospholipase D1/2
MPDKSLKIIQPDKNCWQAARADRAALLLNGEAYFAAFHQAVLKARKQVFILGWDIHSKVELLRGDAADRARAEGLPTRLGHLLDHMARSNPDLDIRILIWNFSMLLSLEREPSLLFNLGWAPHPRIHFRLDDEHPFGASHHQKIVVVDGQTAFCGGLDLTHYRWDTSEHLPDDPRRTTPAGDRYAPFHDAMMLVDGQAAAALAELCATRWERATRKKVVVRTNAGSDAWPESIHPWFEDVDVAIARTEPEYKSRQEIREVEALYLDAFQAARRCIFIENQYFTSPVLCRALEERLQEEQGPEVVIILPKTIQGWLGNKIMEAKRGRILNRLIAADKHGRLRLRHPWVGDQPKQGVMVHAKLMVVDDKLLRVGSSNLCNRSLGLDTECDLAIEAHTTRQEAGVRRLRNELLAEHCGVSPDRVDALTAKTQSIVQVVDELSALADQETIHRGLGPLEAQEEQFPELVSESEILDPERPLEMDRLMDAFIPDHQSSQDGWLRANWLWLALGAVAIAGLAAAWRFTPLSDFANREALAGLMQGAALGWGLYPLLLLAFVIGGLAMFPVTVLIGATAIMLEPLPALLTAFAGTQLSAAAGYGAGMRLGRKRIQHMAGSRLNRISKHLARHGLVSVAVIRTLPIAPFTIVNLVAGASHIRFLDYVLGTLLGMAPGILAVTIFTDRLLAFLKKPDLGNILIMVGAVLFLALVTRWLKRRLT